MVLASYLWSGTNNLSDISAMSKFEKSPNGRAIAARSRNSSVSETSTSDTRSVETFDRMTLNFFISINCMPIERQSMANHPIFSIARLHGTSWNI